MPALLLCEGVVLSAFVGLQFAWSLSTCRGSRHSPGSGTRWYYACIAFVSLLTSGASVFLFIYVDHAPLDSLIQQMNFVSRIAFTLTIPIFSYLHGPAVPSLLLCVALALSVDPLWDAMWGGSSDWITRCAMSGGHATSLMVLIVTPLPPCGEVTILSTATFLWVGPLLSLGSCATRPLAISDCFHLPQAIPTTMESCGTWTFRTRCMWSYIGLGIIKFLCDMTSFASPWLLNAFLSTLQNQSQDSARDGTAYLLLLLSLTLCVAVTRTLYDFRVRNLALQVQSSLILLVFRHTVGLATHDLHGHGTGNIVNLMGLDTQRVSDAVPSFHELWSLPIQIAVTLFLLYQQVSWAFLSGLAVVVLLVPINMYIARRLQRETSRMMTAKDARVNLMSEMISNIKIVKYHSYENRILQGISAKRREEFEALKTRKYLDSWCVYLWATTPVLVTLATFVTYVWWLDGSMSASRAFTSITLFNMLIYPINAFPWVVNGLMEALVSYRRINSFLSIQKSTATQIRHRSHSISVNTMSSTLTLSSESLYLVEVSSAYFSFYPQSPFKLSDITFSCGRGDFILITGPSGSGKSALLKALNGHMLLFGGYSVVRGSVAYVGQEPFLLSDTVRENIVFGTEYHHEAYMECIKDTSLELDLASFPYGDHTYVGGSGMTLSGGQKARMALARALYHANTAQVYLLDDVFSSLDAGVAKTVLENVIQRLTVRGKCIILATHDRRILPYATRVYVMEHGTLRPATNLAVEDNYILTAPTSDTANTPQAPADEYTTGDANADATNGEEHREVGTIKLSTHTFYWRHTGRLLSVMVVISVMLMQASKNFSDLWLSYWVSDVFSESTMFYLKVLSYLAVANSILSLIRSFLFAYAGLVAASNVHDDIVERVLYAPMRFFTTNPAGRIINRFSRDQFSVDEDLPFQLNIVLAQFFLLLGSVVIVSLVDWVVAAALAPILLLYYFVQRYYRFTSRELKRLDSVSRSPLFDRIRDVIVGSPVLSGLGPDVVGWFMSTVCASLRNNLRASYTMLAASEWFAVRLQLLGWCLLTSVSVVAIVELMQVGMAKTTVSTLGLALSYAIPVTAYLAGLVSSFTEFEKQLISVERMREYADVEPEESSTAPEEDRKLPSSWPMHGEINFQNVTVRYSPDIPPTLIECNFTIPPGEKIGIVGRTGAGKSSLINALLRLVPCSTGRILIDGVDVKTVSLRRLRGAMYVVPQDALLFTGPLRHSLDPFDDYSDSALCAALDLVGLGYLELSFALTDCGRNLSVGQRQLVSLAGVLLRGTRVLVMDEATTSLDKEAERQVFRVLLEKFKTVTVLCISHHLENLRDFDRVIVVDGGRIVSEGPPSSLISKCTSIPI